MGFSYPIVAKRNTNDVFLAFIAISANLPLNLLSIVFFCPNKIDDSVQKRTKMNIYILLTKSGECQYYSAISIPIGFENNQTFFFLNVFVTNAQNGYGSCKSTMSSFNNTTLNTKIALFIMFGLSMLDIYS